MTHAEIEELLGAYALDAVEPHEAEETEKHLEERPRCRAEVQSYEETAALIANAGAEAPPGLWDKIADAIADSPPSREVVPPSPLLGGLPESTPDSAARKRARLSWAAPLGVVAAAAAAALIVLGVQVGDLHGQVHRLNTAIDRSGLSAAVAEAAVAPHRTIHLTTADHLPAVTIIVTPGGTAYWVSSSLRDLSSSGTYQLWGLSHGKLVSLALVSPDPHSYASFRIEPQISKVLVTAEPAGGVPAPTAPPLAESAIDQSL